MIIKYLKHNEIDKTKWDYCVESSVNCMVYGNSWYLDIVCENWDALIADDYEAVMPLPWKSKLGLKYIYHPYFAQQLGLFYQSEGCNRVDEFLQKIPSTFLKYEISLNYLNSVKSHVYESRTNYVLNLNTNYAGIYAQFSENTKRNIKKAEKSNYVLREDISIVDFLTLKKQNMITPLNNGHFFILKKLFSMLVEKNHAKIIGLTDKQNILLGAALFVSFKNRTIYLFSASSDSAKDKSAMFTIVNNVISEKAGKNELLDFEGSMIEGVARFFKGFGAVSEPYSRIRKSKIPFVK